VLFTVLATVLSTVVPTALSTVPVALGDGSKHDPPVAVAGPALSVSEQSVSGCVQ
jgi:hypothetical protein